MYNEASQAVITDGLALIINENYPYLRWLCECACAYELERTLHQVALGCSYLAILEDSGAGDSGAIRLVATTELKGVGSAYVKEFSDAVVCQHQVADVYTPVLATVDIFFPLTGCRRANFYQISSCLDFIRDCPCNSCAIAIDEDVIAE